MIAVSIFFIALNVARYTFPTSPIPDNHHLQRPQQPNAFTRALQMDRRPSPSRASPGGEGHLQGKGSPRSRKRYLVNTPGCQLPDLNPFDVSIRRYINFSRAFDCPAELALTYSMGNTLRINNTVAKEFFKGRPFKCIYHEVFRPNKSNDNIVKYEPSYHRLLSGARVPFECIRVMCSDGKTKNIYVDIHSFIPKKEQVEARASKMRKSFLMSQDGPIDTYNILMLGLDSTSRLNSIRQLPQTRAFLKKSLAAIEMKGYTRVGENTFPNLVPMLTGSFAEELAVGDGGFYDDFPFLWKSFSNAGYRTLFAEDHSWLGAFNYLKKGFRYPPTDYYFRPSMLAMERHNWLWSKSMGCFGARREVGIHLDWLTRFNKKFVHVPRFSLTFLSRLSHDYLNRLSSVDDSFVEFFRRFEGSEAVRNTIILFFSDHGIRFGDFRQSRMGWMEESLPFMFWVLPKKFQKQYPKLTQNMRKNSQRLVTPFDVFKTLSNLVKFRGEVEQVNISHRGISLFSELPPQRSCEDAAVSVKWCRCFPYKSLALTHPGAVLAAESVVGVINDKIKNHTRCTPLKLGEILDAFQVSENVTTKSPKEADMDISRKIVFVRFSSAPGGQFEAIVYMDDTGMTSRAGVQVDGRITRTDKYHHHSWCVHDTSLKYYCFCTSSVR